MDDGFCFRFARIGSGPGNDRHFRQDNRRIFHENRIWQIRFGGKFDHFTAQFFQGLHISIMLCAGDIHIDWGAVNMGDLAFIKTRADLASDGDNHLAFTGSIAID